jgi:phospholipid/cholesterol/gamma-HCH transport system substrate-binding protein
MNFKTVLLVGFLFFGAMAAVGYFTIITEGGPLKKGLNTAKVYFPNAEGIKIGNKVTVQGVSYGYVSSVNLVQFDENGNPLEKGKEGFSTKVEVLITLSGPLKVYDNYSVQIKNESLLSGRVIAIDPGGAEDGPTKKNIVPRQIIDITNNPKEVIKGKTSEDPLVTLSELIAENRKDIRKTISNISEITSKINHGKGTLGKLINEGEIHKNVNTTLTDAQIVLRELREGLEDTREQAPVTSFIRAALSAF